MSEKRIFYVPEVQPEMELPEDEAGHCIRVLRLREGDGIVIADGKGTFHDAVISSVAGRRCVVSISRSERQEPLWRGRITLAYAPTKLMERNEWFIEKAVEIGVDRIVFLKTEHSERDVMKMERVERIAVAAMKQSQKAYLPELVPMTDFRRFVQSGCGEDRFIAHCENEEKRHLADCVKAGRDTVTLIGPEGDFSHAEIEMALQNGFTPVSLGLSRLRTETAALAAVHIMNLANRL
ncbi:MAG: 16S rRNA (uracil(1498)-N(3))-methyltransferase [Bacteroidaceae bacterium]|nr:16S rRNA (uracil(1498)-N(3))-methyltransferase [Bacteroidaceae bacterium]